MNDILILLTPRFLSVKNSDRLIGKKRKWNKYILLGAFGLVFWCGAFSVSLRVLNYFKSIEELGDILAFKLLAMMLVTLFSLLIFSSIITSLSKLYLSKDLALVMAMPVSSYKVFFARWLESSIDSSWMVIIYSLPVLISYGIVFQAGAVYYATMSLSLFSLTVSASGISVILVMVAVLLIPATRMRSIFFLIGLLLFVGLYLAFRLLKPERLVDPEVFANTLLYLRALKTPSSPFLPTTWAFDAIKTALLSPSIEILFHLSLLFFFSGAMGCLCILLANTLYFKGVSKTQTARVRLFKQVTYHRRKGFPFLSDPVRAFFVKEIKHFFRDQTQWSQLFLVGALVIIYIYNFSVLPIEKSPLPSVYLENLLSFLNMGLALFVLTAVTARFAYPAVSIEGEAFWLVRSAPVSTRAYLWIKFFIYFFPLLVLTEILIVATNLFLHVTPFIMVLSTVTVFFMVPGIVSLGIGLGAAFPDFKSENPAQSVTSFGGFVFMVLCAVYICVIIGLEAGPVYTIFMAGLRRIPLTPYEGGWIGGSFFAAFLISIAMIIFPMRMGEKRLEGME